MTKTKLSIFAVTFMFLSSNFASASAGWYPLQYGEYFVVEMCLPSKHGSLIYLQGSGAGAGFKTFAKFKPIRSKNQGAESLCTRKETNYEYEWHVNARGAWGLSFYDPKYKKRYWGWPDGVEVK